MLSIANDTELLNDDYIYGDKKVEIKTKTTNGITYTTKAKQSQDVKNDGLSGDLSCKYNVSGTTMTTEIFTSGRLSHKVELDKTGVKGLKFTALGGLGQKQSLLATTEYVHPHMSVVTAVNCLGSQSISTAAAVGLHGVTAGVKGDFNIEDKQLKNVDGVLNYSNGKEHEATCYLLNNRSMAKFAYSHLVSDDFSVAAEFEYNISADTKKLTMGTKYEVDPETTVKMKIDSAGAVSLSYIQEIRKSTTLTLCSQFDARHLDKPSHKFGLALVME